MTASNVLKFINDKEKAICYRKSFSNMNENNGDERIGAKLMKTSDCVEKLSVVVCKSKVIKPIDLYGM